MDRLLKRDGEAWLLSFISRERVVFRLVRGREEAHH